MTVVVLGAPYTPPPPPVSPFVGLRLEWTGIDGRTWDLTDYRTGVAVVSGGVVGLHMPVFEPFTSESAAVDGRRRRGARTRERAIDLPVLVWSDRDSEEWSERDRAFWGGFSPRVPGTLRVTQPNGTARSIRAYFESDGGHAYDLDPSRAGWALYQLALTAEDPYWYADTPVVQSWQQATMTPFIAATGAPPFNIMPAQRLEAATITNPGDVAAWPTWTIVPDGVNDATVSVTVGGGRFALPVAATSVAIVETNPTAPKMTARSRSRWLFNGEADDPESAISDKTGDVTPWDARPIPAGAAVPITFAVTGNARVIASFRPRYYRAR